MTNTKHDEEITELDSIKVLCEKLNLLAYTDPDGTILDTIEVIEVLKKHNTKLVNENEKLRQTIVRMDTEINNAHKDLVDINNLLNDSNINSYIINSGMAGEIAKKYDD